jgi:hypothetical protein
MTKNVGGIDRIIRAVAGAGLLGWALMTGQAWWVSVIGGVLLFTAAIGWCPPYALLGINTGKKG